ncbi:MAG TPA: DUF3606 domain-containing protein [Casimicrobiaceae bacterium]|nr:DUF3606 domain-containing protein [Casimicrobiaceae bacterium]
MADDRSARGEPDHSRISLEEDYEVRYWTTSLGVSRKALTAAINAVGNSAGDVRRYLAAYGEARSAPKRRD